MNERSLLYFDSRDGSIDLPKLFPAELVRVVDNLPADVIFTEPASGGEKVIGIEFKKVPDLLQCMCTGRFAGSQLPTMDRECTDYWLLVEGARRRGKDGKLLLEGGRDRWWHAHVGGRYFQYDDLEKWAITLQTKAGLKIKWTNDRLETKDWIWALYNWWQEGEDRHKSHLTSNKSRDRMEILQPTLARAWAEALPGIGHEKALRVIRRLRSGFNIAVATEEQFAEIEGIGPLMAARIVEAINKEN